MKAVQINDYGGIEVLEINQNAPTPTPPGNQVLVEVKAASINPIDYKVRNGFLKDAVPLKFPSTMGGDFAGVSDTGEEVYGSALILNGSSGGFAQFAAVNKENIAPKPKNVDFDEASALPLVGSAAIQALEEHIKLQSGQKILIHGGAGGIGHIAIQLAKSLGAYVATTVSTNDVDYAKSLGADEVIDYKTEKFEEKLKDMDVVYDTVGGETLDKSFQVLKKGGVIVSMLGEPNPELAKKHEVTAIGQNTVTNTAHLTRLAELVDSGKIRVNIDKVFPLEKAREAFKYQEEGHPKGKVVLKVVQ